MIYLEGFGSVRGLFEDRETNFAGSSQDVGRPPEIPEIGCVMIAKQKYLLALLGRICARHGTEEKCVLYWILVGKPEAKRPLGRPSRRLEDNIRMDHPYKQTTMCENCVMQKPLYCVSLLFFSR